MKLITRENFRVEFRGVAALPFASGPLAEVASHVAVAGCVTPRPLGDIGVGTVPDERFTRDPAARYRSRCEDIVELIRRKYGTQIKTEILCDETATCSFCGCGWEEETAEGIAAYPDDFGPGDGPGLPVCCERAQVEWRAARTAVAS